MLDLRDKVLEKVVLKQLMNHIKINKLLSDHQSAYRPGHSTETVLVRILNDALTSLDQDKVSALLHLDLSAAFDTVDHNILLTRLSDVFGIGGTALCWFRSYLLHRKQYVVVDSHKSSETPVHFGVPQGSVLGPVLFTLYTTPLSHLIDSHKLRHEMYADDTQLFQSSCPGDYNTLTQSLQECFRHKTLDVSK